MPRIGGTALLRLGGLNGRAELGDVFDDALAVVRETRATGVNVPGWQAKATCALRAASASGASAKAACAATTIARGPAKWVAATPR